MRISAPKKAARPRFRSRSSKAVGATRFLEEIDGPLSFGGVIAAIREGEEWSQAHLGSLLGASKQHISEVERGRKTVSPERAAAWARRLGYSEKQFVELALQGEIERALKEIRALA